MKTNIENSYHKMVFVEGGTFEMGDTFGIQNVYENNIHKVTISNFLIGKYLVTQKLYKRITKKNPSFFKGINLPIENINWYDAIKFCNSLSIKENLPVSYKEETVELLDENGIITKDISKVKGYRLPTEAEWEFAARGGNKSFGYKYSGSNNINDVGWYRFNSERKTHEVGTKKSNELEIFDMSGNVWEWVYDNYDSNYYFNSPTINPYNIPRFFFRVTRGGSWKYGNKLLLRVSYRNRRSPNDIFNDLGIRLARSL